IVQSEDFWRRSPARGNGMGQVFGLFKLLEPIRGCAGPITGGLLLGSDNSSTLADNSKFAVTQDQRNTVRARVRAQATKRVWAAVSAEYGSGLPVELDDPTSSDLNFLLAQFGPEILARVNLDRGRVRPNFSLGAGAGV